MTEFDGATRFDEVLRTAFAAREFTDRPVTDAEVGAILDLARFASSGGNAQGWRVVAIRSAELKREVIDAGLETARRYVAQQQAGERGFSTVVPSAVTDEDVAAIPDAALQGYRNLANAPVLLVIGVDLRLVAAMDRDLDRVGIVGGASVYPFVHNTILAAHARGLGAALTTFATAAESIIKELLGFPDSVAVAAVVPLGYPTRYLTKLTRNPVPTFAHWETWAGRPIDGPA